MSRHWRRDPVSGLWVPGHERIAAPRERLASLLAVTELCGFGAAEAGPVQPLWSSSDKDGDLTLSNGGRTVTSSNTGMVRSTVGKAAGDWYVELEVTSGVAQQWNVGLANASATITAQLGANVNGWAFRGNGGKFTNNTETAYGSAFSNGDVIGLRWNADAGELSFLINNASQGVAFSGLSGTLYLAWSSNNATRACTLKDVAAYSYAPPTGATLGW